MQASHHLKKTIATTIAIFFMAGFAWWYNQPWGRIVNDYIPHKVVLCITLVLFFLVGIHGLFQVFLFYRYSTKNKKW